MVNSSTLLADTIFFVKDFLNSNITDPNSNRPTNEQFVMTSYPTRPTTYPLITIKDLNIETGPLGFRAEAQAVLITLEIRVWANNVKDRDQIAQEIIHDLRNNQIGASGTSQANNLHDFQILSIVNIDESDGPKSKVMQVQYLFIAT